jgi:hypothetical protein
MDGSAYASGAVVLYLTQTRLVNFFGSAGLM